MKAMLFAAGLGTRLKPYTEYAPKALTRIGNTTLLAYNLNSLKKYGVTDVVINVHHFPEMVIEYIKEHNDFGLNICISDERNELLETGGGLKNAMHYFENETHFLAANVDVLTNLNIGDLVHYHLQNNALASLAVMDRPSSRQLLFDEQNLLSGWQNSQTGERRISRECNAYFPKAFSGIQVISPKIWKDVPFAGKFSLIDLYLYVAKYDTICAFDHSNDVFLDVGKPENIEKATALLQNLSISPRN